MPMRLLTRLCTVLGLLAGTATAHASAITYGSYSVLNNQNVTITDNALNITNELGGSGQITLMNVSTGGSLMTWCVDIADSLLSSGSFAGTTIMAGGVWDGINALITNASPLLSTDSNASSALQVAIWEEKYGSALTVSAPTAVTSEAQSFLANVGNGTWKADRTKGVAVLQGNGANQDQAYLVSVPEPASVAILGAGLLALAFRRPRSARQAA